MNTGTQPTTDREVTMFNTVAAAKKAAVAQFAADQRIVSLYFEVSGKGEVKFIRPGSLASGITAA